MRQCSYSYTVGSLETQYGCCPRPDIGWKASSAVANAGCLLGFVFRFCRDVLFPVFFSNVFSFPIILRSSSSSFLFSFYCK